ncbi:KEOPS complex subunit Cgi121 [Methanonatronarchaeum sp. AMET-Sl]|uniref:KEOPS complex subunit Cgi121 n=1 Tax=Methanonatronarchaeum sp. AMET-Sl TaxID=3037654 RepID=UPI00244E3410|nr:KEOPS complex subunit Cgi121 [Methanonatronarchaeum sp. AMET-Sl]WGI17357.1 KEOPS complex subunit Cgi121 [Methanonatronarchaeum sp. AMET-Sl]
MVLERKDSNQLISVDKIEVEVKAGRLYIEDLDVFLKSLNSCGGDGAIQAVNADIIAGEKHLKHAAEKAIRSWHNEPISKSLSMEMLLYIVGERQIDKAIEKAGVGEGKQKVGFVGIGDIDWESLKQKLDLNIDNSLLEYKKEKINKIKEIYNISEEELRAIGSDKIPLLVLERVTLLDTKK